MVGLNGSGKSTLIRCIAGQHFHQHEQILVLGEPAFFSQSLQRHVTYLGSGEREEMF
jgi:ABC-type molybdenum transport system ATPase subunit/photorepair protein PhrA